MFAKQADGIPGSRDSIHSGMEDAWELASLGDEPPCLQKTTVPVNLPVCVSCRTTATPRAGFCCPCLTVTMSQSCPGSEDQALDLTLTWMKSSSPLDDCQNLCLE